MYIYKIIGILYKGDHTNTHTNITTKQTSNTYEHMLYLNYKAWSILTMHNTTLSYFIK